MALRLARLPILVSLAVFLPQVAWADEYPKVVRRDGQVCVQELGTDGAVKESCRAESAPLAPSGQAAGSGWAGRATSARLLDSESHPPDPKGASRGISEFFAGQILAYLTSIVFVATGASAEIGGLLLGSAVSFAVSSLGAGLFHMAGDGQAGIGWAFLGNIIGQVASVVFTLVAFASTSVVFTLFAVLVGGLLPALGSAIALELRDTVLRREAAGFSTARNETNAAGALLAQF